MLLGGMGSICPGGLPKIGDYTKNTVLVVFNVV